MISKKGNTAHPNTCVRVKAPARLHLGFLDLNGDSGRKFGSIGIAINTHHTIVKVEYAESINVISQCASSDTIRRAEAIIAQFYLSLGKTISKAAQAISLTIEQLIPEHSGFGSGTQLALAIGTALSVLHNLDFTTAEIAQQLGRGNRSGIGIATFEHGGFVIDGGNKPNHTQPPPLLIHHQLPETWRMVLIIDPHHQGVHGQQEKQAFSTLAKFPLENSQAICHLTLMQLLPALMEKELSQFGHAITQIQMLIGDHFSSAQGGRYTSEKVASLLEHALTLGHTGIAQSSWGPTGVIFVENDVEAKSLMTELTTYAQSTFSDDNELDLVLAQANDCGAIIDITS